ncbi:MAG: diphosphomevalonate decarboxylase [Myxococcota bacterium]|jgi:diphosphomevalonate decarboxylase
MSTAIAHPNIALVKYWGKRDLRLNLPAVSSLSLTLDGFRTRTTVERAPTDRVVVNGATAAGPFASRALQFLNRMVPDRPPVLVHTESNFPAGAGLASSASGFAALTLAAADAFDLPTEPESLSVWARQGSGSACRSFWGGFVVWDRGERADGMDSRGSPLAPADHWDLSMVVAIVATGPKSVGSTEGMERSRLTSPFYRTWVDTAEADVAVGRQAVLDRNLPRLGDVMESSTLKMHATMHTARPPILYWQPGTIACLHAVSALRAAGTGAWATMDAGPQVKVLCRRSDAATVAAALAPHAASVHMLGPGPRAHLVDP